MKRTLKFKTWLLGAALLMASPPMAHAAPNELNFEGFVTDTSGRPLSSPQDLKFQILDPSENCLLYEETQAGVLINQQDGSFVVKIGRGAPSASFSTTKFSEIFKGSGVIPGLSTGSSSNTCPSGYAANSQHDRKLRVTVGTTVLPAYSLSPLPYANVAENAETVGGIPASSLLVAKEASGLTQANLEAIINTGNLPILSSLIQGSSNLYLRASSSGMNLGGGVVSGVAAPAAGTDAVNKTYADSRIGGQVADATLNHLGSTDSGKVLTWDGTSSTWKVTYLPMLPLAGGTMSGAINMDGNNLLATGHITMSPLTTLNLGTFSDAEENTLVGQLTAVDAGKFWYNKQAKTIKVWDGMSASSLVAGGISIADNSVTSAKIADATITAADIANATITGANIAPATLTGNKIAAATITDTNIAGVGAGKITSGPGVYFTYQPNGAACSNGEILSWNSIGARWECGNLSGITALTGDVQAAGSGPVSVAITPGAVVTPKIADLAVTTAKLADAAIIDTKLANGAVTNAKLLDLAVNDAKINDVSYSKLTNNAGAYLNYRPNNVACSDGQVLKWDATNSRWTCATDLNLDTGITQLTGDVTTASGSGSQAATIAANAVTTSKITDGAITTAKLFTNPGINYLVMTDGTSGSTLVSKACASGQVLVWNSLTGWGCGANGIGTVTSITAGTGLTGGTITAAGNLSVDAGYTANKVVQLDASGRLGVGAAPTTSLDVSSKTDAMAVPRGTTAQRPSSPANGFVRYNTDLNGLEVYANGTWTQVANGASPTATEDGKTLRWNNTTKQFDWFTAGAAGAGIMTLNGDGASAQTIAVGSAGTDFAISSSAGTHTLNIPSASATARGLLTSADWSSFNSKLSAISNVAALGNGKIWVGDGAGKAQEQTLSGDATLTAAGSLTIASGAVTSAKISDGSIATADIGDGQITSAKIGVGNVATAHLVDAAITNPKVNDVAVNKITSAAGLYFSYQPNGITCSNGQTLSWDNSKSGWICSTGSTGTVTYIQTQGGLTGGPIMGMGTISIASGGVTSFEISDGTIASWDLTSSVQNGLWSGDGTNVFRAGNVGIGATTPSTVLDINGAETMRGMAAPAVSPAGQGRIYFDSTLNVYRVSQSGGAYTNLVGGAGSSALSGLTAATAANSLANGANSQVWNWDGLTTGSAFSIGSSSLTTGNILSITGSNNANASTGNILKVTSSGASSAAVPLMINNAGTGAAMRVNDDGTDFDTTPFLIDPNGNVGIGTVAPSALLDINGPMRLQPQSTYPPTPSAGTLLVDSATKDLKLYDGTGWNYVSTAKAPVFQIYTVKAAFDGHVPSGPYTSPVTIETVIINTGDRVILRGQSTAGQNGVYVLANSGYFERAPELNDCYTDSPKYQMARVQMGAWAGRMLIPQVSCSGSSFLTFNWVTDDSSSGEKSVRVAVENYSSLSNTQIDGLTMQDGDRVLVWNDSNSSYYMNGVWKKSSSSWVRASDLDEPPEAIGYRVRVFEGLWSNAIFKTTTNSNVSIGSAALTFMGEDIRTASMGWMGGLRVSGSTSLTQLSVSGSADFGNSIWVSSPDPIFPALSISKSAGPANVEIGRFDTITTVPRTSAQLQFKGSEGSRLAGIHIDQTSYATQPGGGSSPWFAGGEISFLTSPGSSDPIPRMKITSSGFVGIGTATPTVELDVSGALKVAGPANVGSLKLGYPTSSSTPSVSGVAPIGVDSSGNVVRIGASTPPSQNVSSANSIDWSQSNVITTSYPCQSATADFNFSNLKDGGTYRLVVTSTNGTKCTFGPIDGNTVIYKFSPANAVRTSGMDSVYSFTRVGGTVYVSWSTGFSP